MTISNTDRAAEIVKQIVDDMCGRSDGDWWLGNMDHRIKSEVLEHWREIVERDLDLDAKDARINSLEQKLEMAMEVLVAIKGLGDQSFGSAIMHWTAAKALADEALRKIEERG